jgi:hypothetical protein
MIAGRVSGATRFLGAPPDWDEARDGICTGLAIKDQPTGDGVNCMISAWQPTAEELERLNAGASVLLWVVGSVHPPVMVTAGRKPDEESEPA